MDLYMMASDPYGESRILLSCRDRRREGRLPIAHHNVEGDVSLGDSRLRFWLPYFFSEGTRIGGNHGYRWPPYLDKFHDEGGVSWNRAMG
jgi:hypothetical protein